MINKEYNSSVRQTRVKNYLNSLRLNTFEAKGIETSAALSQVYKNITKFSRQAPKSHQGDAHKVEFLGNAVVGHPWSHEPLSRVPTHDLTFQELYSELEAALQLYKEAKLAMLRDRVETGKHGTSNDSSSIFYQGQGRYWKDSSKFRRTKNEGPGLRKRNQFNPLSIQGCFNCDSAEHRIRECPLPINAAKAAGRKIEYYAKKEKGNTFAVHQALADLCTQLDDSCPHEQDGGGSRSDAEVFQSLLCYPKASEDSAPEIIEPEDGAEETNAVYVINYEHANVQEDDFQGACIDSAAQKTVVGKPQAEMYCQRFGFPFELKPSGARPSFRFGAHRHRGIGRIEIRVPVTDEYFIPLHTEVVNIDIPFLLGLDTMTKYGMVLDTDQRTLSSSFEGWKVPLVKKNGHLYYEWDINILFTEAELRKVHRHFFHPTSEKIMRSLDVPIQRRHHLKFLKI